MMFAVKKLKCLGCKTPIPETEKSTLCLHCRPREAEIYTQKALEVAAHEGVFSKLWTQCQRCQGSFHQVGREGGKEGGRRLSLRAIGPETHLTPSLPPSLPPSYPPSTFLRTFCAPIVIALFSTSGKRYRRTWQTLRTRWTGSLSEVEGGREGGGEEDGGVWFRQMRTCREEGRKEGERNLPEGSVGSAFERCGTRRERSGGRRGSVSKGGTDELREGGMEEKEMRRLRGY